VRKSNAIKIGLLIGLVIMVLPVLSTPVAATDGTAAMINTGDTAWMLISTALVFIMTPAVGYFYGGMLRKESFLSMLGQTIIITGMVTLIWVIFGYSLAFGGFKSDIIGNFNFTMLSGVGQLPDTDYAGTIPAILFAMYELMFAIITVALIIGGIAERMKLKALTIFLGIWTILVYIPVAHWVWGGGWLNKLGALDFAGGTVVHITAGASVLAAALVLGKRLAAQPGGDRDHPHNIPMVVLGGALLWMGWFGFNGGSALTSGGLASQAFANTHIAAATAAITWGLVSWRHLGRPSVLGMISGAVAGLVAITPASGFVDTTGALVIGMGAGVICYCGILIRKHFDYDDALDVVGVHGIGGTFGAIATGLFATSSVNTLVTNQGLFYGGGVTLLAAQVVAVIAVWALSFGVTFIALKVLGKMTPLRMTKDEERIGADIIQHGESAYS
jgi:Amt family ammonium transporter